MTFAAGGGFDPGDDEPTWLVNLPAEDLERARLLVEHRESTQSALARSWEAVPECTRAIVSAAGAAAPPQPDGAFDLELAANVAHRRAEARAGDDEPRSFPEPNPPEGMVAELTPYGWIYESVEVVEGRRRAEAARIEWLRAQGAREEEAARARAEKEAEEAQVRKLQLEKLERELAAPDGVEPETALPAQRPPVPNGANAFTYARLEKAVRYVKADRTGGDVERDAKLPKADARRVRRLADGGLLRLNADRKLVVDERIARQGPKYVLRCLDPTRTRWLDPNREPPQP